MEVISKPIIAKEILEALQTKIEEEKQVIVHCCFPASPFLGNLIRIWNTTYLVDNSSSHKSKLIHAEKYYDLPELDGCSVYERFLVYISVFRLTKRLQKL